MLMRAYRIASFRDWILPFNPVVYHTRFVRSPAEPLRPAVLQGLASLANLVDDVAPDGGALAGVACNALWSALQVRRPAIDTSRMHLAGLAPQALAPKHQLLRSAHSA